MSKQHTFWIHRWHALEHSWHQLSRTPVATFLTLAVLSVALLLPTTLLVMLNNAQQLTHRWDTGAGIALYLKSNVTSQQAQSLLQTLQQRNDISRADYISPQEGLQEFENVSGLSDAFAALSTNPLPGVIEIKPQSLSPADLQQLQSQLQQLPQVAAVKLDMQWVKRLFAIVELSKEFVYGLLIILALAVLLIIGNTIRTTVQRYQHEIQVLKLIGASKAFIRRPFLYSGILYGFAAGILATLFVSIFIFLLSAPVEKLALLYSSEFRLQGLSFAGVISLLIFSTLLGWLGSWVAMSQHLLDTEIS